MSLPTQTESPNSPVAIANELGVMPYWPTDEAYLQYVGEQLQVALEKLPADAQETIKKWSDLAAEKQKGKNLEVQKQRLESEKGDLEKQKREMEAEIASVEEKYSKPDRYTKNTINGIAAGTATVLTIASGGLLAPLALAGTFWGISKAATNSGRKEILELEKNGIRKKFDGEKTQKLAKISSQSSKLTHAIKEYQTQRQEIERQLTIVQTGLADGRRVERLFGASEALAYCATQQGSNIMATYSAGGEPLKRVVEGHATLADLETLIEHATSASIEILLKQDQAAGKSEEGRAPFAVQAFVSHVIIPHLDFFVMQAQENEPNVSAVNPDDYPVLNQLGQNTYTLNQAPQNLATDTTPKDARGEAVGALDFSFLRDPSQGSLLQRMERALELTEAQSVQDASAFDRLGQEIKQKLSQIGVSHQQITALSQQIERGVENNLSIRDRMEDVRDGAAFKDDLYASENRSRSMAGIGLSGLGWAMAHSGEPATMAMGHLIASLASQGSRIAGYNAARAVAHQNTQDRLARLESRLVDVDGLREIQEGLPKVIEELQRQAGQDSILRDQTRLEAIGEAFLAEYVLRFGHSIARELDEKAGEKGMARGVDEFIQTFNPKTRLGEALLNLCYGTADSNDLSVIVAGSNALPSQPEAAHEQILKEYVERMMKPNIGEFCAHASKMDLLYQANVTGIGTHFHRHRQTIRGENDRHTQVLFADSFGVKSTMGELTTQGAYDVRKIFGYYQHRHGGGNWMTDNWVRDGKGQQGPFGEHRINKRVSFVSDGEIASHIDVSKTAMGVRQQGPEIGDMFLRICAYDYFYPQAVNSADRSNIMTGNPAAPAAYVMANEVIKDFIHRMHFDSIGQYREKVGEKLDNLIAQSLMDFFEEIGRYHTEDPKILAKKADLVAAASSGTYGRTLDSYTQIITEDALGNHSAKADGPKAGGVSKKKGYELFKEIYTRNLEKTLEFATEKDRAVLKEQIDALNNQDLDPVVHGPGSHEAKLKAELLGHSFENTNWKLGA